MSACPIGVSYHPGRLHSLAGDQQVDDAVHKSSEYCTEQCYVIAGYNKFDDIDNNCSYYESGQSSAKRSCVHSEDPLHQVIENRDNCGSHYQRPYAGYGEARRKKCRNGQYYCPDQPPYYELSETEMLRSFDIFSQSYHFLSKDIMKMQIAVNTIINSRCFVYAV